MIPPLRYVTLDVFTKTLFAGNPLGVVFVPSATALTQDQKQIIAREFNFAETIFVHPVDASTPNQQRIDIFTTHAELPFAGHPTIGAASWILSLAPERSAVDTIVTKAGPIPIALKPAADGVVGARLAHNVRIHQTRFPLADVLRLHPSLKPYLQAASSQDAGFPIVSIVKGMTQMHVQLPNLEALAAVGPAAGGETVSDAAVTKGGYLDEGWDGRGLAVIYFHVRDVPDGAGKTVIRTRMFAGSVEDPATGSAASGLGVYLALTDSAGKDRHDFDIVQGVEMGRRSDIGLQVVLKSDGSGVDSVELSGSSVKVAEGQIRVD